MKDVHVLLSHITEYIFQLNRESLVTLSLQKSTMKTCNEVLSVASELMTLLWQDFLKVFFPSILQNDIWEEGVGGD